MKSNFGSWINHVSFALGQNRVNNLTLASKFGMTEKFIVEKLGFVERCQVARGESVIDLFDTFCRAEPDLVSKLRESNIVAVIWVAQTSPFNGIPHLSSYAHSVMKLSKDAMVFDIGLGCSGYPVALELADKILKSHNDSSAEIVVITGDVYSKIVDPEDRDTAMIFGDALSMTLVSKRFEGMGLQILGFSSHSQYSQALNTYENRLQMDGREVYEFVLRSVPEVVSRLLRSAELDEQLISRFFVHQGSAHIVKQVQKALQVDNYVCPFFSARVGNLVSSSIPYGLSQHNLANGFHVLLGFGVGLQTSALLLRKIQ